MESRESEGIVICTGCGQEISESEAIHMDHSDTYCTRWHCPRCAEICAEGSDDMVTVETMPDYLRESHRAAGNWGEWPMNGARRNEMTREEAEEIIEADPDGYARIV